MWEKNRVSPNVTKIQSNVMLILPNMTKEPLNVRKKINESLNVIIVQSHVMLELYNVRMNCQMWGKKKPLNVTKVLLNVSTAKCNNRTIKYEKKNKRSTKCDKSIVTCNVGIAQYEDRTVNMKKKKEPLNVTKVQYWQKYSQK